VTVSRTQERNSGRWELHRKRKAMGVRLWEGGFQSFHAAELAGKQALEEFLNGLSIEIRSEQVV
jgi:hypothetical protein